MRCATCFSCQGFSVIGHRDPEDPRNGLVTHFARLVEEIRPRSFAMENVPGLLSPAYRGVVERFRERLQGAGYETLEPQLLNAGDHGVPQERRRVFVLGWRHGLRPVHPPIALDESPTVGEALDDLPELEEYEELLEDDTAMLDDAALQAADELRSDYAKSLREGKEDNLASPRSWDPALLTSSGRTRHSKTVIDRFRALDMGAEDNVSRLPRLHVDRRSPTLRAGTGRDHGSFTSARPIHHLFPRVISVREAARLQSFPDWFRFHKTKWHGFRQVGNAVPPAVARRVGDAIAESLELAPEHRGTTLPFGEEGLLELSLRWAAERYGLPAERLPPDVRRTSPT